MSAAPQGFADPRKEALEYLEQHKLLRLFDLLGAKLAVAKPDNPNAFLLTELNKISALVSRDQPVTIFSEQDLEVMFTVYDITKRGWVSQAQYTTALQAVGVDTPRFARPAHEKIDKKTFVTHLFEEIRGNGYGK
jgi:hypothetical protein